MANPFKEMAKAGHDKKIKAYSGGNSQTAKSAKSKTKDNWDGEKPLNTNEQAGLGVIFAEPKLSQEVNPRIMRKAGGSVKGKMSLKRLDKAPRKKREDGGELPGPYESMHSEERLKGLKSKEVEPDNDRDDGMPSSSEIFRRSGKFQNYKKGGKVKHDDEAEDRALVKKMVKPSARTGKSTGGQSSDSDDLRSQKSIEAGNMTKAQRHHDEMISDYDDYGSYGPAAKKSGGRAKRDTGGRTTAGKNGGVNIYINDKTSQPGAGGMPMMGGMPPRPPMGGGMPPMPPMGGAPGGMPPMPPGGMPPMPPMGGAPGGLPPGIGGAPGAGMPGGGMPPRPFKRGGKVRSTQDLTAGAGSGEGRLQKEELEKSKAGRKGFI